MQQKLFYFLGKRCIIALCMQTVQLLQQKKYQFHYSWVMVPTVQYWTPIITRLQDLYCSLSINWVNKTEVNKQLLAEILESSNTAFEHYLGEVEK